jgi:hypothetical protein
MSLVMDLRQILLAASVLALASVPAASQIPTCGGTGLSVSGGRFGDAWSIGISGPPGAAAVLAADAAPGPVPTPFGPVCLGLSPAFAAMPLTLGPAGSFATSGILPLAPIVPPGSTQFVQAAIAHPSLPGGLSLTNGFAVGFRPPQLGVFGPAIASAIPTGNVITIDGTTNAVTLSATPSMLYFGLQGVLGVRVPRLGWFGWIANWGDAVFVDDFTGATALTVPGATGGAYPGPAQAWEVTSSGSHLISCAANVAGVRSWSLPTGNLVGTAAGSYSTKIHPIPGTTLAYLPFGGWFGGPNGYDVFDAATATIVASVSVPGVASAPLVMGNLLYVSTFNGIAVIDLTTHSIVAFAPVPTGSTHIHLLAFGPGSAGPALWGTTSNAAGGALLVEVSPATLTVQNVVPMPAPVVAASLSAGGTEWLLEVGDTVHAFNPVTLQSTPLFSGISPGTLTVLRSDTLRKAYVRLASGSLLSFPTDPATPLAAIVPLPPTASTNLKLVSN